MAFNMLSELPAIHACENTRDISSSPSTNTFPGSSKMISAHSSTSIASNESATIATTSSDNISTISTDNSDTCMSDSEGKTISTATEALPTTVDSTFITESAPATKARTGSLTRHELKHHSLWATNVEIQDKTLPDFPSAQTRAAGETRIRGKGEKGEDRSSSSDPLLKPIKDRICGLQTLHLAHNSFSGKL